MREMLGGNTIYEESDFILRRVYNTGTLRKRMIESANPFSQLPGKGINVTARQNSST